MTSGAERRKMERFTLQLPAKLAMVATEDSDQAILELLTSDVCAGGAFFQTGQPLPPGTEVKIDLVLPLDELKKLEGKKALIKVRGAVVRTTRDGMAIAFNEHFDITSIKNQEKKVSS